MTDDKSVEVMTTVCEQYKILFSAKRKYYNFPVN